VFLGVYETAVVAQKHRMLDEVPVAFVIPTPGTPADEYPQLQSRIQQSCQELLADFKQPRVIYIVLQMPRSTLEKVHKLELRKGLPELG
jgi:carnitine-CoA ligase